MSRDGDELDEMSSHPRVGGGATPDDQDAVAQFLVELRALGRGRPPEPSPQVAALLAGATLLAPRRHAARVVARSVITAAAVIGALVIAAVNRDLPQPAQRVVSDVLTVLTPFDIAPQVPVAPTSPTRVPAAPKQSTPTTAPVEPGEQESSSPGGADDPTGSQRGSGADDGGAAPPTSGGEDDGGTAPRTPGTADEGRGGGGDE